MCSYEGIEGLYTPAFGQDGQGVDVEFGDCALQVDGQVGTLTSVSGSASTSALEGRLRLE